MSCQEGGVSLSLPLFCNQWRTLKETGMVILQLELANSRLAWSELIFFFFKLEKRVLGFQSGIKYSNKIPQISTF